MPTSHDALKLYKSKRNFSITSEPEEGGIEHPDELTFVIQKHWASRLHYDFRLELDGTMKSWAVPKGPSYDTHDKRMAVHVEDHPISYSSFEGTIPEKQYGAGKVIVWDKGTWHPVGDPHEGYAKGNLKFEIRGHKMHGRWVLVRMKGRGEKQEPWLLIKEKDEYTRPAEEFSVVDEMPDSVAELPMPGEMKAKKPRAAAKPAARRTAQAAAAPAEPAAKPAKKAATKTAGKAAATKTAAKDAGPNGTASKKPAAKKPAAKTAAADAAPAKSTRAKKAAMPASALKAELPDTLKPELATLVDKPPASPADWIFEIKFDGYRLLARVEGKEVRLFTRNGNDWTRKMMQLHDSVVAAKLPDGWYDGEIVVHDDNGRPDFGRLQMAFDGSNTANIVFFIFDAPYLDGHDLRGVPLDQRREVLRGVLEKAGTERLRFSEEFGDNPAQIMEAACRMGLEGIIGKKRDSLYVERRSPEWIKLKCQLRQEFVIAGYTDPQGSRTGIGSLLLGVYDKEGQLQYAGNVGTGFNEKTLRDIYKKLTALDTDESPFPPKAVPGRKHHWVKPKLVAEVSFAEWTKAGSVRHAVFQGLREDKQPKTIGRELPKHMEEVAEAVDPPGTPHTNLPASLKVTNPERLIDKQSGSTKIDLIRYYALVGPLMMEHLKGRPLSLVRAPAGVGGELFFQKHADVTKLPGVKQMPVELDPDHPPMLHITTAAGLLSSAQWNVVEFHTQNALCKDYERPNRIVFDLDPGEGVEWKAIQEGTQLVHAFLDQLGLASFVKTSGGKGLHVVVPIKPQYDWDTVKDFSQAVVQHLASTLPDRFAFKSGPKNRVGKIFIDYLRNGRGATTACAWSARVRPGLGISVPISWEELPSVKAGDQWNIKNAHTRLDKGNDPWADYAKSAKSITAAMKKMGLKAPE
ncbi:MAG TPA: DNA ligase D [Telluria sp.]|nr:DNA ligase D [Telluria sp.]